MLGRRVLRTVIPFRTQRHAASTAPAAQTKSEADSTFTRYAGIAFFGAVAVTAAYLGTWQIERYYWKVDLINQRTKELSQSVADLPEDSTASNKKDDIEFRQLRLKGNFKPGSTFYLYPRSAPADPSDSVARVRSGGYVYSLLQRESGTPVIVNRGWLPRNLLDAHMALDKKEEDGMVSFVGVLRHGEVKNRFTPANDPENRQFSYLDHGELADAMGVTAADLPVMVDALAVDDKPGDVTLSNFVRKNITSYLEFYMTPEKHVGYAVTCMAAAVMGYLRFKRGGTHAVRTPKRN
ncbi:hypothetical protein CCR75_005912 [Bremia lactucae]|uniref:SURF1-like protein n=1 Tax=Bremia lactucae TaxID=4779 RepID=A0A976FDR3_BRELC|nr:hypothetical protein CCR75_005912 [Bremia lactucae]